PLSLGGGIPDVRLVPAAELARAMRRVLKRRAVEVLSYGDPAGPASLRSALAFMVSATRGVAARAENVLVTRGSQMGIDLTTLAPARRLRLLEIAREQRLFVLEDDYDHEFHYEGRPVLPLASADVHGVVVYLGTLSKVLAPGMRIGFVVAPEPLAVRLAAIRR